MANCPICGAQNHSCGGPTSHSLELRANPIGIWKETRVDNPNQWTADTDYYVDAAGKVTQDRDQAVTLLVRAGQPLELHDATRFGLLGDAPDQIPPAAGLTLARQQRTDRATSVTGLPQSKVIPTGHPAFSNAPSGAEEGADGETGNQPSGEVEERKQRVEQQGSIDPEGSGKGEQTPPEEEGKPEAEAKAHKGPQAAGSDVEDKAIKPKSK